MSGDYSTTIAAKKTRLRRQFASFRAALGEVEFAEKSTAIVRRLLEVPEIASARSVHVYWPLLGRREVDVRPLIQVLHGRGTSVYLPIVSTFAEEAVPNLAHGRFRGAEQLTANRWGLMEPDQEAAEHREAFDVIIVPAFGAGRNGHRLGHGRGYYDRFLQTVDGMLVCPVYDACLVDVVPFESHDVAVDLIVTESVLHRPAFM